MNKTKIEWVKNPDGTLGFTSNPVRGKCPVDCSYCYVKPLRKRFGWSEFLTFHKEELDAIRKRQKPSGIFVGSVMELFHENTIGVMPEIIQAIKDCPHHRFYLLTKQPQNLIKFSPFPDNCYVGFTATTDAQYMAGLKGMEEVKAKVKFISFEPLLEEVINQSKHHGFVNLLAYYRINGVIIGSLTFRGGIVGSYPQLTPMKYGKIDTLQPKIEWVEEIVDACDKAGIPVFLKNNLKPLLAVPKNMPANLILRQEMPEAN